MKGEVNPSLSSQPPPHTHLIRFKNTRSGKSIVLEIATTINGECGRLGQSNKLYITFWPRVMRRSISSTTRILVKICRAQENKARVRSVGRG